MTLEYFDTGDTSPLVKEFFYLSFDEKDIPFESTILPVCYTAITCTFDNSHKFIFKKKETEIKGLIITGQFYESYQLLINRKGHSYGISFHPTTIYKLTNSSLLKIKNKHLPLAEFSEELNDLLYPIFLKYENDKKKLTHNLKKAILKLPLKDTPIINKIDKVIDVIHSCEGMLNTYDLLDHVDFSQKTLETHFKKIVGLTPGKYIRLCRFLKLMRQYESKTIDFKDLTHMYNYYDHSHFFKDFKHFMKQTPKDYFKSERHLLNKYLNK